MSDVVVITGIAGGLAQLVGAALERAGHQVIGVDYRPVKVRLRFAEAVYQANYNKTRIEDVFRRHRPDKLLHLGRVGNLKERMGKRFDLNVVGSRKLLDLCLKYEVKGVVVHSTFHIYGAHPANHIPIFEDEPLRAGIDFPQIADAVQLDTQSLLWLHEHREVKTVLLRPCNVVGPHLKNAMSTFLRLPNLPVMIGFDPMVQLIHEQDLISAILAATRSETSGVYNVAGPPPLPWRTALGMTGARLIPVPSFVTTAYLRLAAIFGPTFPSYLVNFFKYPCIISDQAFRKTYGWEPSVGEEECIRSTVGAI